MGKWLNFASRLGIAMVLNLAASEFALAQSDALALESASMGNNVAAVRSLLAKGADINAKEHYGGETALIAAAAKGSAEMVNFLLSVGADPNIISDHGSALTIARLENRPEIVNILAPVTRDNLFDAAFLGDVSATKSLLSAKADPNAKLDDGRTPLMVASFQGQVQVVRALLAAKADVNAVAEPGLTPLILASRGGHIEVVRALLAAKADVKFRASDGTTALSAQDFHHADIVRALLAAGADVNTLAPNGATVLMEAAEGDYLEVVRVLIAAKADVNFHDRYLTAALGLAEDAHHEDVAEVLICAGATRFFDLDGRPVLPNGPSFVAQRNRCRGTK
jgi:serine/threonine-protein phosphatase 6 regulatory ankyrin repeat subunit B